MRCYNKLFINLSWDTENNLKFGSLKNTVSSSWGSFEGKKKDSFFGTNFTYAMMEEATAFFPFLFILRYYYIVCGVTEDDACAPHDTSPSFSFPGHHWLIFLISSLGDHWPKSKKQASDSRKFPRCCLLEIKIKCFNAEEKKLILLSLFLRRWIKIGVLGLRIFWGCRYCIKVNTNTVIRKDSLTISDLDCGRFWGELFWNIQGPLDHNLICYFNVLSKKTLHLQTRPVLSDFCRQFIFAFRGFCVVRSLAWNCTCSSNHVICSRAWQGHMFSRALHLVQFFLRSSLVTIFLRMAMKVYRVFFSVLSTHWFALLTFF